MYSNLGTTVARRHVDARDKTSPVLIPFVQGGKGKGKAKGQQNAAAAYQQLDGTGKSQVFVPGFKLQRRSPIEEIGGVATKKEEIGRSPKNW